MLKGEGDEVKLLNLLLNYDVGFNVRPTGRLFNRLCVGSADVFCGRGEDLFKHRARLYCPLYTTPLL